MGLFNMLFGGKERTRIEMVPDRIWMTADAKFAGMSREVALRSSSPVVAILLVAHFPDVLARLETIAANQDSGVPIRAVSAADLNRDLAASLSLDESSMIDLMVGERHPLPSVDDQLQEFAEQLPCRCRLSHHLSMDDAVIQAFAGDRIQSMLKMLGMTEHESIDSPMVSRRIQQSQKRLERRTCGHLDAHSASEWIAKNCPVPIQSDFDRHDSTQ